jgi:hypothetical protein
MATYSYGLKSVKYGAIDPVTGLPTGALADIGKIYRDTGEFTQEDAAKTQHFAELEDDPVVSFGRKGLKSIRLRLMDTAADNLVKWLGGTVVEVALSPDQWEEPDTTPVIEYAFEIETEEGAIYGVRRGQVDAKLMIDPKRSGFSVIDVMITPLKPLVGALKATFRKDPPLPA